MDLLDELIEKVTTEATLSASALNALHGATSTHPWCERKSLCQRKQEVLFAIEGRGVHLTTLNQIKAIDTTE